MTEINCTTRQRNGNLVGKKYWQRQIHDAGEKREVRGKDKVVGRNEVGATRKRRNKGNPTSGRRKIAQDVSLKRQKLEKHIGAPPTSATKPDNARRNAASGTFERWDFLTADKCLKKWSFNKNY